MVSSQQDGTESAADPETDGVNRRSVLRTVGTGTAVGVGVLSAAGTASAHEIDEVVFCGCSQVCACGVGTIDAIVAHETDSGFTCERVRLSGGEDPFSLCYEPGEEVKIIGVELKTGEDICNPNRCAEKALADCEVTCESYGQSGGPCGNAFLRTCGE